MVTFSKNKLFIILGLMLGCYLGQLQAGEFRYRYVSLANVQVSENIVLNEFNWINDVGDIYGNAYECGDINCTFLLPHIAIYRNRTLKISQSHFNGHAVNRQGLLSGEVIIDPQTFPQQTQAALYLNDKVTLIPPLQTNEFSASAVSLNDRDTAVVASIDDQNTNLALGLYRKGETIPLTIDPTISGIDIFRLRINNQDIISGLGVVAGNLRGFRHDPKIGRTRILNPLPTEPHSLAMDINNKGNVLGYSFVSEGLERIGIWDKDANFKTYFVEGTPEFPTISNNLLFNDQNLIVITNVTQPPAERSFTYVVPKPGKRINLADLIVNLPVNHSRQFIISDINNRGDLLGFDRDGYVLLKHIDD